ncbi:MAG: hypothetical protein DRG78_06355 [Epsilonproteobacteria bacterium]|nr:MAG: hypothetical protein DRG78_06355 [Campylobacterota bacterium]
MNFIFNWIITRLLILMTMYIALIIIIQIFSYFILNKQIQFPNTQEIQYILLVIVTYIILFKITSKRIQFGKYKGKLWNKLPDDYLSWLTFNTSHGRRAQKELDKRNYKDIITFGKYKGSYYSDLSTEYLFWLNHNTNGDASFLAHQELDRRV